MPPVTRRGGLAALTLLLSASLSTHATSPAGWPNWRGPSLTGVAPASVPVTWSDTQNIRWKIAIPGRGHSTPVAWGDKLFLTTAIPAGTAQDAPDGGDRRGPGGGAGAGQQHRLEVLAIDRATGRTVWQRTATTVTPHEGYHHWTAK